MATWEIILIMVSAAVCVTFSVTTIYSGMLNAIDNYKTKRAQKGTETYLKIIGGIPDLVTGIVKRVDELEKKKNAEKAEKFKKYEKYYKSELEQDE